MQPNEAIKQLQTALKTYRPEFAPKYFAQDLADLRLALVEDGLFAAAVAAVAHAVAHIHVKRDRIGKELQYELQGWRRYSFESSKGTDLRIVYRVLAPPTVRLLGFGQRHHPQSIYWRLLKRIVEKRMGP